MEAFWDESWARLDPARLAAYIEGFDRRDDSIMEELRVRRLHRICDAGCGCGMYALKLCAGGFAVSGFDIAQRAVDIARTLLNQAGYEAELKTASVLSTGYADDQFDAVIARDVLDHMPKDDAHSAMAELYRMTRPGGMVVATLDAPDEEYEAEPHSVSSAGDYVFTAGKWAGMVFHPYTAQEAAQLIPPSAEFRMTEEQGALTVCIYKPKRL